MSDFVTPALSPPPGRRHQNEDRVYSFAFLLGHFPSRFASDFPDKDHFAYLHLLAILLFSNRTAFFSAGEL
jgi:hypothetical protein